MARKKRPTSICPLCDAYIGLEKFVPITHLCAVPYEFDSKIGCSFDIQVDMYLDTRGETRGGEVRDRIYCVFTEKGSKDYVIFRSGFYVFPPQWELVCGTVNGKLVRAVDGLLEL